MYKICLNNDKTLVLSNPRWIKLLSNDTYIQCDESEALGVCINGIVYKLKDKEGINTNNVASVCVISEAEYQNSLLEIQERIECALAELSILMANGGASNV